MLLQLWNPKDSYNFLYVPYYMSRRRWAKYGFVNCVSHEAAITFRERWQGWRMDRRPNARCLDIQAAKMQGLEECLQLFGQREVMKYSSSPVLLNGNERLDFHAAINYSRVPL